jgi:hypothetical protein
MQVCPTKHNLYDLFGISYSSALRQGLKLSDIQNEYRKTLVKDCSASCLECGTTLTNSNKKFCNQSCSAKFNNKVRLTFTKQCCFCNSSYLTKSHVSKFCSSACGKRSKRYSCYAEYLNDPICDKIVESDTSADTIELKYSSKYEYWVAGNECIGITNPTLRKYLTKLYGYKCSCCGLKDWNNKIITLEVEHLDGDSNNNLVKNLCLLCPNCHSQTSTYKGRNKGKGRHKRMQRYLEGKSY